MPDFTTCPGWRRNLKIRFCFGSEHIYFTKKDGVKKAGALSASGAPPASCVSPVRHACVPSSERTSTIAPCSSSLNTFYSFPRFLGAPPLDRTIRTASFSESLEETFGCGGIILSDDHGCGRSGLMDMKERSIGFYRKIKKGWVTIFFLLDNRIMLYPQPSAKMSIFHPSRLGLTFFFLLISGEIKEFLKKSIFFPLIPNANSSVETKEAERTAARGMFLSMNHQRNQRGELRPL